MTKASPVASTNERSQGSVAIQPKSPRPPRRRPAISIDAEMVKTVSRVGTTTRAVKLTCRNLNAFDCSGSISK
jgi:hypothetical protein